MGLDAVVYKNSRTIVSLCEVQPSRIDPHTGEVVFEGNTSLQYPPNFFEAARMRLGNVDTIRQLRNEVEKEIGKNSLLVTKVLVSGTHSGDILSLSEVSKLEDELIMLQERADLDQLTALGLLSNKLKVLVTAARENGNPIVFV